MRLPPAKPTAARITQVVKSRRRMASLLRTRAIRLPESLALCESKATPNTIIDRRAHMRSPWWSFASFWPPADHFRSPPINRHAQVLWVCLKRANRRLSGKKNIHSDVNQFTYGEVARPHYRKQCIAVLRLVVREVRLPLGKRRCVRIGDRTARGRSY